MARPLAHRDEQYFFGRDGRVRNISPHPAHATSLARVRYLPTMIVGSPG